MCASLGEHLKRWAMQLQTSSDSPRLDAEILLKHATGLSDVRLITQHNEPLDDASIAKIEALIKKRRQGQPIAHLTGQREFYSLLLKINNQVLIPRPETELLVDAALERISRLASPRILDLGTGSGAVSLAIARQAPHARILATDRKESALQVARENARAHRMHSVRFALSDWFRQLQPGDRFDLIVSNPPYIDPEDPHLEQGDVRFEPRSALVAGEHGLADIRAIIEGAPGHLERKGYLLLEHGCNQGAEVRYLLDKGGFTNTTTLQDLNRLDRVSLAQKP